MRNQTCIRVRHVALFICAVLVLLLIPGFAAASPLPDTEKLGDKYITLVASSEQEIILDVRVDNMGVVEVKTADATFQKLSLTESGVTSEIGKAELPVIGQLVAIPAGAAVNVQVLSDEHSTLPGYWVYPAQKPQANQGGAAPPFAMDQDFYRQDVFYPQAYVTVSAPQTMRGMTVVRLAISPLQFNPARRELRVTKYMRIRLTFIGGRMPSDGQASADRAFQNVCQGLVLNCSATETFPALTNRYPSDAIGADYLIISAPDYVSTANTLAEWKNRRGIKTVVKTTNETGTTTTTIKSYIQTAYNAWSPKPSYVLFLGDADAIPVFYKTVHPNAGIDYPSGHKTGTDLYYATMDGDDDRLPDLNLGRISASSLAEANHIVSKIIAYETNPPGDPAFYSRMAMATQFQDENLDGKEELLFSQTTETIRDYWLAQGYNPQRIYEAAPARHQDGAFAFCD